MPKKKRWSDLSGRTRHWIMAGAGVEGALKVAALIDLWRRPSRMVNGSKAKWAVAVILINSAGVVPLAYFAFGRRKA